MKISNALVAATWGLTAISSAFAVGEPDTKLMSQAKVSESDARLTALSRVPNGVVKSFELEVEHGKLVWSFDISQSSVKRVTEIQVDAVTGKIVSLKTETPAQEAKEAKAEANEVKAKPGVSK